MKLSDNIANIFLILLGFISGLLNKSSRNKLGKFVGNTLKALSSTRAEITRENISQAFPEFSKKQRKQILIESYQNLGITLVELLAFPKLSERDFRDYVKYENVDLVKRKISEGRGLILLSGHFGNWELVAYTAGLVLQVPITIVVKPQSNKVSDIYLNNFRTQGGNSVVPMAKAAREILKTIKRNEAVAMLVDQSADWQKDVFVDFFNKPAATYEAPAVIALKYRTPIITGFAHRQSDCTYKVILKELDFSDLGDTKESILELTKRHVAILEENIRQNPGHWSWQHKRWKHQPQDKIN